METPKERAQRDREKAEFLSSIPLREDYRNTFSSESGRRVLEHFIDVSHQDEKTFTGNSLGMFQEGARAFVLMIKGLIPRIFAEVELARAIEKERSNDLQLAELLNEKTE